MSLLGKLGVDLEKMNAKELEDSMKGNGLPAIGLHHAVLEGCREVQANSGSQGYELRFKIIGGASKGLEVKETLWISEKEKAKNRVLLFMHRLAMLTKVNKNGVDHFVPVAGKVDLHQCIGTEVVIDVAEHETRESNGKKYTDAKLSFEALLKLDDKRCEKVARGTPGAVTMPASVMSGVSPDAVTAPRVPAQQTFDDI
jgi:hypothetical protein